MKRKRGKYSRAISNTRRAINKLGGYSNKPHFGRVNIKDLKTTPLYVEWTEDGTRRKEAYKDLSATAKDPQELRLRLQVHLSEQQELEALHQFKTRGKVSWQFKKSVEGNYSILKDTIALFEKRAETTDVDVMGLMWEDIDIEEDVGDLQHLFETSDDYNQFYHEFGFQDLNLLTANLYRALKGDESIV